MANKAPAVVNITAVDINGNSVAKSFTQVREIHYDFFHNTLNIVDATGSFYFGYSPVATNTWTIAGGVTTITIAN